MKPPTTSGLQAEALLLPEPGVPEAPSLAPQGGAGDRFPPPSLDTLEKVSKHAYATAKLCDAFPEKSGDLLTCGNQFVHLTCKECGHSWDLLWRCDFRLCPSCGSRRAVSLLGRHRSFCGRPNLKHLVLTEPNHDRLAPADIDRIRNDWRKLRRRKPFSQAWKGGIYSIEVSWNPKTRFNLHIHVLIDGNYLPHSLIRRVWEHITGGQRVVWITRCKNSREVLKYICKPTKALLERPDILRELIAATQGKHLTTGWGWGYRIRSLDKTEPRACPECGCRHFTFEIVPCLNERVRGPP